MVGYPLEGVAVTRKPAAIRLWLDPQRRLRVRGGEGPPLAILGTRITLTGASGGGVAAMRRTATWQM